MRKTSMRKRLVVGAAALSLTGVGLVIAGSPAYPTVSGDSGFEAADADLKVDGTQDWNSFTDATWAPITGKPSDYQIARLTSVAPWEFTGLTDPGESGTDDVFGGGTKQNDECATVKEGPKPPNKDDLIRVYFAHGTKQVTREGVTSDHVFLNLAWIRIPQNTTSASAHVAFEFNKSATSCNEPGGLVERVDGDMLIVYDFEGSSTDEPTLKLLRWLESASYEENWVCEVGSRPCWGGPAPDGHLDLTDAGFAEAAVNTVPPSPASIADEVAPGGDTLGASEFGEAGIDLTDAGVFTPGQCESFGKAYAVSRSSGNSAQAQMKDLVGPGDVNINNCGALRILKKSTKTGNPLVQTTGATFSVDGPDAGTAADFLVSDNLGAAAGTPPRVADEITGTSDEGVGELCVSGLPPGNYSVTETAPPTGYADAPSSQDAQSVAVVTGTNCGTSKPADAASGSFKNAPLADIQVNFRDGGSGETSLDVPISCVDADENATLPTGNTTTTTGWDDTLNVPGIPIDPSPRTVVCTIVIDP